MLPGPPSKLHLTNIDTDYAVVHWSPPATLADTVQHYNLHYNSLPDSDSYRVIEKVKDICVSVRLSLNIKAWPQLTKWEAPWPRWQTLKFSYINRLVDMTSSPRKSKL